MQRALRTREGKKILEKVSEFAAHSDRDNRAGHWNLGFCNSLEVSFSFSQPDNILKIVVKSIDFFFNKSTFSR